MKLNENGDFCLLYVEPADEKQSLFATIGEQQKPVVLMLSQVGQPRSRLFQRPEDFSDLKYVRRQSGVSVVFVTAGSERLAQMAARYGFPAYPSIDDFADFLANGRRNTREREEGETRGSSLPLRRVRTGPLIPSTAMAQLAAMRKPVTTRPLEAQAASHPWTGHKSDAAPIEQPAAYHDVPTIPIGDAARLIWPPPGDEISSILPATPPVLTSVSTMPTAQGRVYGYRPTGPLARGVSAPLENGGEPPFFNEVPRRRSMQSLAESQTRYPDWQAEEREARAPLASARPPVQDLRNPLARPSRPLSEPPAMAAPGSPARASSGATGTRPTLVAPVSLPGERPTHMRGNFWPLLIILSLLIIVGGALGSFVALTRVKPAAPTGPLPVGSLAFRSSEQLNENTSQGIDDQVQITLRNLTAPASGKSYYAWLLGDTNQVESQSILLGKLKVVNGSASLFYAGDAQHTNLLQLTSRFLVTEEDGSVLPLLPSPDINAWRYYGILPAVPDPNDPHHYSFLNHLRHLLADEPILDEMELPGGLNNWFTRNTQELIQMTSSARDRWQNNYDALALRRQGLDILAYLDGMSFLMPDVPAASADVPVTMDTHLAALGLLTVRGATQNPPSYVDQIAYHLNGLLNAPGSPSNVRAVANRVLPVLSNVATWLQKLRTDDKKLLALSDTQLGQPAALSLLNDMVSQASNAYSGNADPTTNQAQPGTVWIHQQLQSIATINVNTYVTGQTPVPGVTPSSKPGLASVLSPVDGWREGEALL